MPVVLRYQMDQYSTVFRMIQPSAKLSHTLFKFKYAVNGFTQKTRWLHDQKEIIHINAIRCVVMRYIFIGINRLNSTWNFYGPEKKWECSISPTSSYSFPSVCTLYGERICNVLCHILIDTKRDQDWPWQLRMIASKYHLEVAFFFTLSLLYDVAMIVLIVMVIIMLDSISRWKYGMDYIAGCDSQHVSCCFHTYQISHIGLWTESHFDKFLVNPIAMITQSDHIVWEKRQCALFDFVLFSHLAKRKRCKARSIVVYKLHR